MATRIINGKTHTGSDAQLDLYERYIALKGKKVEFPTERGMRRGTVTGYSIVGGSPTWRLQLTITYRSGQYHPFVEEVEV